MKNINIEIKKLDYLYDNISSGIIGISLLSLIIVFSFYNFVDTTNLLIWFALNGILLFARVINLQFYKKTILSLENFSKFYYSFAFLTILTALLWGSAAFIIMPENPEYRVILLMFVFGLVTSATVSLSSRIEIFYAYLFSAFPPYIYVLISNYHDSSTILVFTIVLSMFVLFSLARKISKHIEENIEIAFKNENLILQLEEKVLEANVANHAKSEFLSVMSHEIRTPLNAILGFVSILKKTEKDAKKYKYLDTIDKSSKILTNVINDILDITKIESGKLSIEQTTFHPKDEFHSLYLLFQENAKQKDIEFINSIDANIPDTFVSDVLRIKQIVSNLLSNAIKFTDPNKTIELIIKYNEDDDSLYFEVRDEGIGISEENIEKITQPFVQADSSTVRKYGGTGLGLSISTSLLKLLGSKLSIESTLDKGSRFSFSIASAQKQHKEEEQETSKATQLKNKNFLVAEDNKTNQMLIEVILDELEVNVTIANDGVEAENIFKEHDFDLVLMDINMPNKNGLEAMRSIKEYEKNKKKATPIIALTANAVSGDKDKYLADGFDGYISKPIEMEDLLKVLNEQFSHAS